MKGRKISDSEISRLQELLAYDALTGILTWRMNRSRRYKAGTVAGTIHPSGYRIIEIDGVGQSAHRVAYILHTGQAIPKGAEIDHRDGNRSNNAASNLRLATTSENAQNRRRRSDNRSGYIGVSWHRQTGKWWAQIAHNGRRMSLGLHGTAEAASRAYLEAKQSLHGFQPTPRT